MHHTIEPQTETPKRFQCRHIFTDGHRCGSPCLRGEDLCYYHHTTRKPAPRPRTPAGKARRAAFEIPLPEDRSAIQHSIGQVLQRIAANDIDPRRAGLLLYGLQIASLNLPKPSATQPEIVEETTSHPELGTLAPPAEVGKTTQRKSAVALLIDKMIESDREERQARQQDAQQQPAPQTLPTLQATADPAPHVNPLQISQPRDRTNRLNYQQSLVGLMISRDRRRLVLPQPNAFLEDRAPDAASGRCILLVPLKGARIRIARIRLNFSTPASSTPDTGHRCAADLRESEAFLVPISNEGRELNVLIDKLQRKLDLT
jgi:hypothetical protein